jgi:hypothetical protein
MVGETYGVVVRVLLLPELVAARTVLPAVLRLPVLLELPLDVLRDLLLDRDEGGRLRGRPGGCSKMEFVIEFHPWLTRNFER